MMEGLVGREVRDRSAEQDDGQVVGGKAEGGEELGQGIEEERAGR